MAELLDIVDEEDNVTGSASSEEIHEKYLLHRAVHILIIDSKGRIFCRQRSPKKERYPGYWSTSAGSHIASGESYEETTATLKNDLGISELEMIGKIRVRDQHENEMCTVYIGHSDKVNINGRFFSIDEIKKLDKFTPHLLKSVEVYIESE